MRNNLFATILTRARQRPGAFPAAVGVLLALLCWGMPRPMTASAADEPRTMPANGDFEKADPADNTKPLGWDKPDGLGVQWTTGPRDTNGKDHGKAIRMDTSISEQRMVAQWRKAGLTQWDIPKPGANAVAETYGLSFYSVPLPVKAGQAYRITFDYQGASGGAKVWVRGWGNLNGELRRRYETIVNCRAPAGRWTTFSQVFHPTRSRPEVTEMRVMLYAYYPAGIYWFDNVKIELAE
jgi:hypothetical protein